jgi:hypothetical protein
LIIFGFLPESSKTRAVAVGVSVRQMSCGGQQAGPASLDGLDAFRGAFYDCLTLRRDALFELAEAVLCAEGPVSTLVGLTLTAEHRRGHGALYDGLGSGRVEVGRLRRSLVSLPVPRDEQGRITLALHQPPNLALLGHPGTDTGSVPDHDNPPPDGSGRCSRYRQYGAWGGSTTW